MNSLDIIVFDLETGGLSPDRHEAVSVAAVAYNARTLEPYPAESGGEFNSLMRPLRPDRLEDEALRVNGLSRDELAAAPEQAVVWNQFVAWVGRYNRRGTASSAPIAAGKNIRNFDLHFVNRLCEAHCPKKGKTVLFNTRTQLELEDLMFLWYENDNTLPNMKMDTLRDHFGLSREGAHSALVDARQTGMLLMRFLKLHRSLRARRCKDGTPFIQFAGCFNKDKEPA